MVIRSFFDKNNTILSNNNINTGMNPVAELFYGGPESENKYSRFLFHFDETRLRSLYTGGTIPDLSKLKHTLKLTNTGSLSYQLLNGTMEDKVRTSSFDLILFKINQYWDEGTGYDYSVPIILNGNYSLSIRPSNWINPQLGIDWSGGTGVYSGSPSGITIATMHFDKGNENISVDVTQYVNGLITGDTNYGLGLAFSRPFEQTSSSNLQYVGFFTRHTQTFYEPYLETIYSNYIKDDRNNFFLDKNNKLYLYVNVAGNPTNLDSLPSVTILDQNGDVFSSYTSSDVTHVTKGVYSIDILVPTTDDYNDCVMLNDVWDDIVINGVNRPSIELGFALKDSSGYYSIGDSSDLPKSTAISVGGIRSQEQIKRGDIRKVIISARIPYTVEQTQNIDSLKYRLYVREGKGELTVVDFEPVEMTNNSYYFLLDTESLIPNTYYLDILVSSNLEVTTIKNVITFDIVNQVESRKSQ